MKSPVTAIANALTTLLSNITYRGNVVKVFTYPPQDNEIPIVRGALHHYIEIGEMSDVETNENSDTFTHDISVDLQVVVGFPGMGSRMVVDEIVSDVMEAIQPTKGGKLTLTGFKNVVYALEIGFETQQDGGLHKTIVKTLRYRFTLDET